MRAVPFLLAMGLLLATANSRAQAPAPTPAAEGDIGHAQALHDKGVRALEAGRFAEAAAAFDAAWLLDPHPILLWNAARAHDLAGATDAAIVHYQRVIDAVGSQPEHVEKAKARLAVLEVAAKERDEPAEPAQPAAPDPGEPELASGLRLAPAETDPVLVVAAEPEGPSPMRVAGWTLVGVSIAAGVAAGGTWLAAVQTADDLERQASPGTDGIVDPTVITQAEAVALEERVDRLEIAAVGLGAAAGAVAITGALLLILGRDEAPADATLTAGARPGGLHVGVVGRF